MHDALASAAPRPPAVPARVKPVLRGVSHQVAAIAALPLVLGLLRAAAGPEARLAAAVFGGSLVALFASSALYHRPTWPPRVRDLLGRVDHAAIFLLIAGSYTPLCLLLGAGAGHRLLALAWGLAALGVAMAFAWDGAPKPLRAALYVGLGWLFLPTVPALRAALGDGTLALLIGGGALYTLGAVIFARRWPDPAPAWFGFHEIFHLLVIAAAGCHLAVMARVVRALG